MARPRKNVEKYKGKQTSVLIAVSENKFALLEEPTQQESGDERVGAVDEMLAPSSNVDNSVISGSTDNVNETPTTTSGERQQPFITLADLSSQDRAALLAEAKDEVSVDFERVQVSLEQEQRRLDELRIELSAEEDENIARHDGLQTRFNDLNHREMRLQHKEKQRIRDLVDMKEKMLVLQEYEKSLDEKWPRAAIEAEERVKTLEDELKRKDLKLQEKRKACAALKEAYETLEAQVAKHTVNLADTNVQFGEASVQLGEAMTKLAQLAYGRDAKTERIEEALREAKRELREAKRFRDNVVEDLRLATLSLYH